MSRGGGEGGAAERRLSEALQAQASLGARSTPAPAVHKPPTPKRAVQKPVGRKSGQKPVGSSPTQAQPAPTSSPVRGGAPSTAGQSGPHGRGGQSGPQRPAGTGPHGGSAHLAPSPGRTGHSGGQRARPRDDQLPTTKVATAEAGLSGAPTTQQPATPSAPAHPPTISPPAAPRPPLLDTRLRVALIVGLLVGAFLGCALALLSVVEPGLLPALG